MSKLIRSCFCAFMSLSCFSLMAKSPTPPGHTFTPSKTITPSGQTDFDFKNTTTGAVHSYQLQSSNSNPDGTITYQLKNTSNDRPVYVTTDANGSVQSVSVLFSNSNGTNSTTITAKPSGTDTWDITSSDGIVVGTLTLTQNTAVFTSSKYNSSITVTNNADGTWTYNNGNKGPITLTYDQVEKSEENNWGSSMFIPHMAAYLRSL